MDRSHLQPEKLATSPLKRRISKRPVKKIRMILIGKTGEGKSATGNTLLGRKAFDSCASSKAQTRGCKSQRCVIDGCHLLLADTPGLFDTDCLRRQEIDTDILKFLALIAPGPHAILYVVSMGRYTEEQRLAYEYTKQMLGNHSDTHTIVILTGRDNVEADGGSVEEFMSHMTPPLARLISSVGCRYVAFNNRAVGEERQLQVRVLMRKVEDLMEVNRGSCYTSKVYKNVEQVIEQEVQSKIDPILTKTREEVARFQTQIFVKQDMVETLKRNRSTSKDLLDKETEELLTITLVNEEKMKKLQTQCDTKIDEIRENFRDDIATDRVVVNDAWLKSMVKL